MLKSNTELSAIHFVDVEKASWVVGKNCESITVKMESGQMAGVPWALIKFNHDTDNLVNLSTVESVDIKP
jgi:hypothetical protein